MLYSPGFCCIVPALLIGTAFPAEGPAEWPVEPPVQVMNTVSTFQSYGPRPGFHHGLDLKAPAGTPVYSPVSGKVGARYYYKRVTPYTYEVSVETEDNLRWEFHHVLEDSVPAEVHRLAKKGGRIEKGQLIGRIYDASSMGISPHVHINVIDSDGYYLNPLKFFPQLEDTVAPRIQGIYFVNSANKAEAEVLPPQSTVSLPPGKYELVVEAADVLPPSQVGQSLYRMHVERAVNGQPPASIGAFRFDRLPHASFLEGADTIFRVDPVTLPDGSTLKMQAEPAKDRTFLYRFPYDYRGDEETLQIHGADFNGNETEMELSIRPR